MLAGAGASLSLPPLFLLPAIFALSIPFLGYIAAQSWREAAAIFAAAGFGWFLERSTNGSVLIQRKLLFRFCSTVFL